VKQFLSISGIILWAAIQIAAAQTPDSAEPDTAANFGIAKEVHELNCIEIKPTCACRGTCTCGTMTRSKNDYYSSNTFSATDEILTKKEGVSLIRRGNYAMEPVLRGMSGGQVNLTIDGMKIFSACTDRMDPVTSYIEPNNLKSISVSHGSSGAQFGSSVGGSVDMKLNEPIISNNKIRGEAGAGFQSTSLGMNGLLSLNYSHKRWAILANTVYRHHNDYRAGGGNKVDYSGYQKWNFSASGKILLSENDILRVDFLMDDAKDVGYPALPMDVAYAKARIYALTYKKYNIGSHIETWETKVYANTINHAMDDTQRPDVAMHMDMPGTSKTFGGFTDARMKMNSHQLKFRAEGYNNRSKAEMTMYADNSSPMYMLTWPDVANTSFAGFAGYDLTFGKVSTFSASGRLETVRSEVKDAMGVSQFEIFNYDVSEPRLLLLKTLNAGYSIKLKETMMLSLNGGYGERAPSVSERYGFYIFNSYDGYDYIGNPDMKSEKSAQAEISFAYSSHKLDLKPTAFYYYIKDYIASVIQPELSTMTPGANGMKFYENIPHAQLYGGSFLLTYRPSHSFTLTGNLEYVRGIAANNDPLPLMPPFKSITAVQYTYRRFSVKAECEAATKQNQISPTFGEIKTPAYGIFNMRGTYSINFSEKVLSINSGVENLLDTNYREHLDWGGIPRSGINFYVNVKFSF
jgi:iron complex outermembrane recepter protein